MLKCKNSDDVIREFGSTALSSWDYGSALEGFCRIEESDILAKPDPTTFQLMAWRPGEPPTGRMFCHILHPDGRPFDGDSHACLRQNSPPSPTNGSIRTNSSPLASKPQYRW